MTIGLCYIQQLPASVGRQGLAGRLLVDHLRREFEVVICDGVFDSPPVVSSAEHLLADDFLARRFDAVYIEGGAFWGESFLTDEASRERERRGGLDPLRGPRTLQHAEWTAELGGLAQLHNDVEQRTRELVQLTLLAEERHRGEHGWAERMIILAIPERERERVGSGSADQLLSRLYWTDLIAIIGRQWRLFERIFGDRNELRHKAQVINDRAHAHAKPLDVADLALYRREVRWFKAKLDQAAAIPSGGGSSA